MLRQNIIVQNKLWKNKNLTTRILWKHHEKWKFDGKVIQNIIQKIIQKVGEHWYKPIRHVFDDFWGLKGAGTLEEAMTTLKHSTQSTEQSNL